MTMTKRSSNDDFNTDTRLALLEHTIGDINKTMERFEKRFDRVDEKFDRLNDKIDSQNQSLNNKMDSQFKTTIYMILGLYAGVIGTLVTALGKAYHWF